MPCSERRNGSGRWSWRPAIAGVVAFGNKAVERLFRDVSYYLYAIYAVFIVLALWRFGAQVPSGFAAHPQTAGWALNGLTYFGYNIIGAVVILPVLRHLTSDRDAVVSGVDRRAADDAPGAPFLHSDGRPSTPKFKARPCPPTSCSSGSACPPSICCSRR